MNSNEILKLRLESYDCNLLDNQRWEVIRDTDTDKKLFIKNPFTSKTLYLEKRQPDVDVDNQYIYKYNDSDNENNGDNCNANQKQIILEKKTVKLDKKCINMNDAPTLLECPDDNKLNYYVIDDKITNDMNMPIMIFLFLKILRIFLLSITFMIV